VLASPWSPPKEWKSNNSINGGGHLIHAYRRQFANYLKNFARHMYDNGAPIYAISIANEPNYTAGYDGCEWSPAEMRDFYKEVGRFTNGVRGFGGGVEIPTVLTVNGESANNPNINDLALNDPISNAVIDLLARHVYGDQQENLWNHPNRNGKEVWMTEHNINSANATAYPNDSTWNYIWRFMNDVDLVMRLNNENAFVWWASKRFYSMLGDGQFGTRNGVPTVRGYGLSHYAKFTIDTTRVGVSVTGVTGGGAGISQDRTNTTVNPTNFALDNLSAKITAYVSADGNEISMILWTPTLPNGTGGRDMGRIRIDMPAGFEIGGAQAVRSTADTIMVAEDVDISGDRKSAFVNLPASHLLSVRFMK
jgi:hypothetical protein